MLNLSVVSRLSWNRHHYREAGDRMVQLRVERTIAASPERVFDWLADPTNLANPLGARASDWAHMTNPGQLMPGTPSPTTTPPLRAWQF